MSLRDDVLDFVSKFNAPLLKRDIYIFGVYKGQSIAYFLQEMAKRRMELKRIIAFDSFEGLPDEDPKVVLYDGHKKGMFSAKDFAGGQYEANTIARCIGKLLREYPQGEKVEIVKGWFSETLTPALVSCLDLKPALFVEIDVDLYISTKQLLEFMTKNHLIVPGTILYYDDWGEVDEYTGGESLAHKEWVEKYRIECERLSDTGYHCNRMRQTVFVVKG